MDNRDLQEKLLETLNEINSSISFGETSIKDSEEQTELAQKLIGIYSNSDFRHSYASISSFLEGCMPDQRDALIKKLVAIHEYVIDTMPSTCDKECVIKSLTKLRDHVELESIRINRMKHISHIGEKIAKEKSETEAIQKDMEAKSKEIDSVMSGAASQAVTILGIFAGIVTSFSLSANMVQGVFQSIDNLNYFKILILILVLGLILFDVVFMLLYAISKISNKSIASRCRSKSCDTCRKNHNFIQRFVKKYSYVFMFNVIIILAVVLILAFNPGGKVY